jgi:hypothetical protein
MTAKKGGRQADSGAFYKNLLDSKMANPYINPNCRP